jgi:hypothetical protein
MFQTKVVEEVKTLILFSITFLKNHATNEIRWKNIVKLGRPHMTKWRMHIACWICKATNAHSEYVILIAFPLQLWLHERNSMLYYTYIACLVSCRVQKGSHSSDPSTLTIYDLVCKIFNEKYIPFYVWDIVCRCFTYPQFKNKTGLGPVFKCCSSRSCMRVNVIVCTHSFLGKLKNHDDKQCSSFRYVLFWTLYHTFGCPVSHLLLGL